MTQQKADELTDIRTLSLLIVRKIGSDYYVLFFIFYFLTAVSLFAT